MTRKSLLLGAGFSYDLGMPLASELTEVLLGFFGRRSTRSLGEELSKNEPYGRDRPINRAAIHEALGLVLKYRGNNYEALLAEVEGLGNASGKSQSDRDSYHYVRSLLYSIIHRILVAYQRASYELIYHRNMRWFSDLGNLLADDEETWAFTLNHDLYLECLALDLPVPITYGDTLELVFPLSNIDSTPVPLRYSERSHLVATGPGWFKGEPGVNLVRLHGGLSELEYKDGSIICNPSLNAGSSSALLASLDQVESMAYYAHGQRVPSGKARVITGPDGDLDIISQAMLTGGNKYSRTTNPKKGEEKLTLLDDVLIKTDELTVIGYSFGDVHVNNRVLNAMVRNRALSVRIVDPAWRGVPPFLEQFDYDQRVRGAICGAAQWMTYVVDEKWNQEQATALKMNTAIRVDVSKRAKELLFAALK